MWMSYIWAMVYEISSYGTLDQNVSNFRRDVTNDAKYTLVVRTSREALVDLVDRTILSYI